ncbi:MAG: cytochrome C [Pseudomonadota bacterium]
MDSFSKVITTLIISISIAACGGGDDDDVEGSTLNEIDASKTHQVLAFNDLGMHCADLDYSTFVILPPFNVVHAHVIEKGAEPRILSSLEVDVDYKAVEDADLLSDSINTTSQNQSGVWKTNFWDINPDSGNTYVFDLFGIDPQPDEGLAFGQTMPGILNPYTANDPQAFNHFDPDKMWFAADGIPILPIDDAGEPNPYPLMQVSASNPANGDILASQDVVLPVASEADCQNCHAIGEVGAIRDGVDFVFPEDDTDANSILQAAKINILLLHDAKHPTDLFNQQPVLCAGCHYSVALDLAGTGPAGEQLAHDKMSQVMHGHHGELTDPATGDLLFPTDGTLEETCYQCHPGKTTKCLRGAMGNAGIVCQDCHGGMLAVGNETREPWLDEPRCESCHTGDAVNNLAGDMDTVVNALDVDGNTDGIRLRQAWYEGDLTATPITETGSIFAEDDNQLYRNSLGHGGVACEACHGSTHAIWPIANPDANDNEAAKQLQGYSGTIIECGVCHTSLPLTPDGGPHGMHNVNSSSWNLEHEDFYEDNPNACKACHGLNLEGTVLSRTATDRQLYRDDDGDKISVPKGTPISCTLCHGYPD